MASAPTIFVGGGHHAKYFASGVLHSLWLYVVVARLIASTVPAAGAVHVAQVMLALVK